MSNILDQTQVCEKCLCEINATNQTHATYKTLCERCGNERESLSYIRKLMTYTKRPSELRACPICGRNLIHIGIKQDAQCPHCHLWFLQGNTNERDHTHDFVAIVYSDGRELRYNAGAELPFFDNAKSIAEVNYEKWCLRDYYNFNQYLNGVHRDITSTGLSNILDERSDNQKRLDDLDI